MLMSRQRIPIQTKEIVDRRILAGNNFQNVLRELAADDGRDRGQFGSGAGCNGSGDEERMNIDRILSRRLVRTHTTRSSGTKREGTSTDLRWDSRSSSNALTSSSLPRTG